MNSVYVGRTRVKSSGKEMYGKVGGEVTKKKAKKVKDQYSISLSALASRCNSRKRLKIKIVTPNTLQKF